jgi:hypothetical protein
MAEISVLCPVLCSCSSVLTLSSVLQESALCPPGLTWVDCPLLAATRRCVCPDYLSLYILHSIHSLPCHDMASVFKDPAQLFPNDTQVRPMHCSVLFYLMIQCV